MRLVLMLVVFLHTAGAMAEDPPIVVSPAHTDANGFLVHDVTCPYQPGTTHLRILRPTALDPAHRYPVIYVLPVEAGEESRYGDGLAEVKRGGLADRVGAFFIEPTFAQLPWYADHPTDPAIRQESYLLKVV